MKNLGVVRTQLSPAGQEVNELFSAHDADEIWWCVNKT